MKKILFAIALFPLVGFASNAVQPEKPSIFKKECENIQDPKERNKACLNEEKQKEANQVSKNFQENSHVDTTF